jgi:hypothetical protein
VRDLASVAIGKPPKEPRPKVERFDADVPALALTKAAASRVDEESWDAGGCAWFHTTAKDALLAAYAQGWKDSPELDRQQVERLLKTCIEQKARIARLRSAADKWQRVEAAMRANNFEEGAASQMADRIYDLAAEVVAVETVRDEQAARIAGLEAALRKIVKHANVAGHLHTWEGVTAMCSACETTFYPIVRDARSALASPPKPEPIVAALSALESAAREVFPDSREMTAEESAAFGGWVCGICGDVRRDEPEGFDPNSGGDHG